MADQCKECGAELLPRQRFCRQCGIPVARPFPKDILPQPSQPETEGSASTLTTPLASSPVTDKVSLQPTAYSSPQSQGAGVPPASTSPKRSLRRRFLPLLLVGLIGGLLAGLLLAWMLRRSGTQSVGPTTGHVKVVNNHTDQAVMSEDGARVSDNKTVITGSYPLGDDATVSLTNITGNITIEGWDQPQAEVRVTKEGGSEQDRQAVQIKLNSSKDLLSLETSPTRSGPVETHYEIKLPSHVRAVEIKSADSAVKLSQMTGAITISVQGSSIELKDISGAASTKIVKGETKVTLNKSPGEPQELSSISGDIELRLDGDINADIVAETIDGEIKADDDLEMKTEKRTMGQSATVRIGRGGVALRIKTINGDIRIKK